ncbi:MAG: EAL domain-containing protein [Sterolibacterium sp.]|jgi:diguanylate cyclase (GGDEF)-like protein/PAS domain S-box-containing protein
MDWLHHLLFGDGNRIGRRLIVLIIGFSSLITLILSVVQLALEYRDLRGEMDRELDGVAISVPTIAGSLWDFDTGQLRIAVESLSRLPNVVRVAVTAAGDGKRWEAGTLATANVVARRYSLRHSVRGEDREIGSLEVVASLDTIYHQVVDRALSIVLGNGLKTFLVATFMVTLFGRLVTRRLHRLQREVVDMGQQILPSQERLGQVAMPHHLDEIDSVAWRLDQLRRELAGAVAALRDSEAELHIAATAFESQEAIMVTDANSIILRVNRAFTALTGYAAEEVVGQNPRMLQSGRHDAAFYRAMWETIGRSGAWQGEVWDRHKNGQDYPRWLTISAVKNDDGVATHYVGVHFDISERKQAEKKINELAYFDQLTGLPNRTLLLDRLRQTMTASSRSGVYGALLFIDLDNFKTLNDTLGHDVGDLLLKRVAQRLTTCVRAGDTAARLGGDEFVVMLSSLSMSARDAATQTEVVGEKILAALNQTYQLKDVAYHNTPSVGATLFSGHQAEIEDLLKQAELAMYKAKASGRNALRFFDPDMELDVMRRAALEKDLREAVNCGQFLLHYQAQVAGDRLTGAEVLVRWQHPRKGLVSPGEFIPLAEETGLILQLGNWVLETSCAQLAAWASRPGMDHLTIAVNVSARQFRNPDFVDQVSAILDDSGADPRKLKLELTESLLVSDVEEIVGKMFALRAKGVRFSLDDFGTGYSSLAYLKRLPLNQLKIDQSFVRDVLTDPNDASIAKTIIALAQNLGLGVIAEGVETEAQKDFLMASGCHAYQGYFFSRPLALQDFEQYVLHSAANCGG